MKIKTSELIDGPLDWAVAKAEGRVLVEPSHASNASVGGLRVPFELWDVRCTYHGDNLISATPSPIRVDRFGIDHRVGATAPSISFSDDRDRNARGSVDMFYMRRDDAEQAAQLMLKGGVDGFEPSTDWAQGGPIVGREKLELRPGLYGSELWACWGQTHHGERNSQQGKTGPTPLIAAMRCFVASRLGDEVELPDELVQS